MKIYLTVAIAVLAAALSVSYCKKADDPHVGHMMDTDTTKSVMLDDVQVVFDLMDSAHHEGMMAHMGGKHGGAEKYSHYVLLTMMKKTERKLIMDAEVTFTLTGPDGKSVEKKSHVMTGMGMHHYAVGFDMKEKGDYMISAAIKQGGRELRAITVFTLK